MTAAIYMSLLASLRESLCRILPSILFAGRANVVLFTLAYTYVITPST